MKLIYFSDCGKRLWTAAIVSFLGPLSVVAQQPAGKLARPTPEQAAWQDMELEMFLCLDPCTWQNVEYDNHTTPLSEINPEKLDTDQWARVAVSMGARQILFVAKHTGGFCWWQTETSKYGVKETPWRGGRGDVIADLSKSCREHGLRLGIYLSSTDDFHKATAGRCKTPEAQQAYTKVYRRQLTEVLSRYGEVSEIWFDGGMILEVRDIIEKHAPHAVIFGAPPACRNQIRWVGNEEGYSAYPNWNAVRREDLLSGKAHGTTGDPNGEEWMPVEVNTVNVHPHYWFWKPDAPNRKLRSLDELLSCYYHSVGRGGVFLLNMTPDTSGLIPEADAAQAAEFGQEITRRFAKSIAETSGQGNVLELALNKPTRIDHVVTMENILEGERVREYVIEGLVSGQWKELCSGTSIGHKKIDQFSPTEVSKVRWRCLKSAAEPQIRKLAAYSVGDTAKAAPVAPQTTDAARKVWEWSLETVGEQWKTVDIDLTPFCKDACQYQIDVNCTGGNPLEIQSLQYVFDGTVLPEFVHKAAPDVARYYLTVTGLGKPLALRAVVRGPGDKKDSRGTIAIRKRPL
jgi:alpha-L-fucosidase